jgi:hypothetical protein
MNNAQNRPIFNIAPMLPGLPRLKIVDVGAMSLGEGTDPYSPLTTAIPCDVYGFEPAAEEFEKLKASASRDIITFRISSATVRRGRFTSAISP